ncbi:MAG: hypothetical protein JWN12_305 [Candidatus Saccharibacteria bacterium]|nr:hypothetical protein [Candidatus Saccharibacteria bacterium]
MKKKLLGLLVIPLALGAIGLTVVGTSKTHAESPQSVSANQASDVAEPGDTPDSASQATDTTPDAETND